MTSTKWNRRRFLKVMGGAAGLTSLPVGLAHGATTDKPNILLIMADDVGRDVLGCYGGESYETPNLDKLAATGTRFTHCYSAPVCSPSRVKIMTGRYGFRTTQKWGHIPADEITFGHALGKAGYATAVAGKWQMCLQKKDPQHVGKMGFQDSCVFGWHEGPRYHAPLTYQNGKLHQGPKDQYGPDLYFQFLLDFMERNRKGPFLAYYPMALCHAISDDFTPPPPPGPDGKYQTYKQLVEYMDKIIGRLVAGIEKLGLREKTLILYTTDNGTPRSLTSAVRKGKHIQTPVRSLWNGRSVPGGKGKMTDAGTRVPLIANCPGVVPSGAVCDDLIDFSDFLPTLAELAGAKVPSDRPIDGRSFAPQLRGLKGRPREWVHNLHRKEAWVRTKRWKLYRNGKLFDVETDADEKKPVREKDASPEAAVARKKLQAVLDELKP